MHQVSYDGKNIDKAFGFLSQTWCFLELDVPDSNKAILSIKMTNEQKKTCRLSGYFQGPYIYRNISKLQNIPTIVSHQKPIDPPSARMASWDCLNWKSIKHRIRQVQWRIFKASYTGNKNKVYWLQNHLIHSLDAKLIAIQKITKFYKNLNNQQKVRLVQNLKIDTKPSGTPFGPAGQSGEQTGRTDRPRKNSKIQRQARLDFLTIPNQAKQILVQLALEPEWKAKGLQCLPKKKSLEIYREISRQKLSADCRLDVAKGNVHDAIQAISMSLGQNRKWIYQVNIREYLKTINHDFLLKKMNTYPIMELQIRNWLTQGLFVPSTIQKNPWIFSSLDRSQNRKQKGPSQQTGRKERYQQNFSIESLFIHIALHGLESHLKDFVENLTLKEQTGARSSVYDIQPQKNQQKVLLCPSKAPLSRFYPVGGGLRDGVRSNLRAVPTFLPSRHREHLERLGKKGEKERKKIAPVGERGRFPSQPGGLFIRYEYDFVIIHESKEIITLCRNEIQQWLLNHLKAKLNPKQFLLKDGPNGFSFLDFQIIQIKKNNKYKVKIVPSKKSQKAFLLKIRKILQKNKATSAYQLIQKLRPIIIDWGNYFKFYDCKRLYRSLTNQILKKIRAWVFRRDPRSSRHKIKTKYFPENKKWIFNGQTFKSHWVLYGQTKGKKGGATRENFLPHLSWFKP